MLSDYIQELIEAIRNNDQKRQEQIYKFLDKVGMDRMTVRILVKEMMKEGKA